MERNNIIIHTHIGGYEYEVKRHRIKRTGH